MYQGNLEKKAGFKTCWMALPKVMFWNILIERNQRVFKDKSHIPEQIVAEMQALMGEILNVSLMSKNKTKLTPYEVNWMDSFNVYELETAMVKKPLEVWELRMDQSHFEIWMKERKILKLFFDMASKGNPGATRGGGIISCPEGNIDT